MTGYLTFGTILGLSAGFAPGPLLALVISETLKIDVKAGLKVAIAPILTDFPIVLFTVFLLKSLPDIHGFLGPVSILGAAYVGYMAIECIRVRRGDENVTAQKVDSLGRAVIVNLLSPHPYLFWFSVGAPTVVKAQNQGPLAAGGFVVGFYLAIVLAKATIAVLVGTYKDVFAANVYTFVMRLLAGGLIVFAMMLFQDGLRLLALL